MLGKQMWTANSLANPYITAPLLELVAYWIKRGI